MHSFLLIGQSNMAGRGFLTEAKEIDVSHVYTLRNGRWHRMFRPIHSDRAFAGVCLAESFAEAYANKHGVDVGLICCADGGTSLDQWQKGEALYDHAVAQAKLAQRSSTIVGVLWHQGESDCAPALSQTYRTRFERVMKDLREDLCLSDVPFVLGELGDFLAECPLGDHLKLYARVNEQLREIVNGNPRVGLVSAKGLTANPDLLHFNADSLYEFGLRYFREFEKMEKPTLPIEGSANENRLTEMERL